MFFDHDRLDKIKDKIRTTCAQLKNGKASVDKIVYVFRDELSITHRILSQLKRIGEYDKKEKKIILRDVKYVHEYMNVFEQDIHALFERKELKFKEIIETHRDIKNVIAELKEVFVEDFPAVDDGRFKKLEKLNDLLTYACDADRRIDDFFAKNKTPDVYQQVQMLESDHTRELQTLKDTLVLNRSFHDTWADLVVKMKSLSAAFERFDLRNNSLMVWLDKERKEADLFFSPQKETLFNSLKSEFYLALADFKREYSGNGSGSTFEGLFFVLTMKLDELSKNLSDLLAKDSICREDVDRVDKVLRAFIATHPIAGNLEWKVA
ncbi:MAG: hypothetical protein V1866_03590 [archaeon]